jgi:ATP-dependent Lhr-like helicase
MLHVDLDRITPMAVPVLIMIGRETAPAGTAEDELLLQAEALAEAAMRRE